MPENRDRVVVARRRCCLAVGARPFFAVGLCDLPHFGFGHTAPTPLQCLKAFAPVVPRPRLNAEIIIEIPKVNRGGLAECHLGIAVGAAITSAFAVSLEKFRKPRPRYA